LSVAKHVVVVGSGAGGSAAAWVLASAGFQVTVLEKGRNYFRGLDAPGNLPFPLFGGDEIRAARGFPGIDVLAEPRTSRSQSEAEKDLAHSYVGDVNHLSHTVGGGTTHWDAKVPRFFALDFEMRSRYGPVEGADLADWPFGYDELAPYYDLTERVIGVQGSLEDTPKFVLEHSPRGPYPMPPGPPMYASLVWARAAAEFGYEPHPFPMAANSQAYDGRPACANCGYCASHGCPINARGGAAVTFLRRALLVGARLVTRACVTKVGCDDHGRATHVEYLAGDRLVPTKLEADAVVLAGSAIETPRLALLSKSRAHPEGLGNGSGRVGRTLCFHTSTFAGGVMPQRLHAHRGRSTSHCMLEPAVPDTESRLARWAGLPFVRGGVCELGGAPYLIDEARVYDMLPWTLRTEHKNLMRSSPSRDRMLAVQMLGEDLPQVANRVDLDPQVRDIYGLPAPRITYSLHRHDQIASLVWARRLQKIAKAAGTDRSYFTPAGMVGAGGLAQTRHIGCTMRMGKDAERSVSDEFARLHDAPNVIVCDGSALSSFSAVNPTLTIMAVALRSAAALAYGEEQARKASWIKS
jgi:choline dehydrogenase-like flavoprotein